MGVESNVDDFAAKLEAKTPLFPDAKKPVEDPDVTVTIKPKSKTSVPGTLNSSGSNYDYDKRIPLCDAISVGQAVRGTDAASAYVCVAVGVTLNAAVRFKGSGISLRVEPSTNCEWQDRCKAAGMTVSSGSHASVHFTLGDQDLLNFRAAPMGFLYSMDEDWLSIITNMKYAEGLGQ